MTTAPSASTVERQPLLHQTVAFMPGVPDVGRETARAARAAGADVLFGEPHHAHGEGSADAWTRRSGDDAHPSGIADVDVLIEQLPEPVDHLVMGLGGLPGPTATATDSRHRQGDLDGYLWLPVHVAQAALKALRPEGTLLFVCPTGDRRLDEPESLVDAISGTRRALIAGLAREMTPIRVNCIGACLVDRPLSARLLGVTLDRRRDDLRATLPIARVVRPSDVAALAVHLMANTAVTGATYDLDCGKQARGTGRLGR